MLSRINGVSGRFPGDVGNSPTDSASGSPDNPRDRREHGSDVRFRPPVSRSELEPSTNIAGRGQRRVPRRDRRLDCERRPPRSRRKGALWVEGIEEPRIAPGGVGLGGRDPSRHQRLRARPEDQGAPGRSAGGAVLVSRQPRRPAGGSRRRGRRFRGHIGNGRVSVTAGGGLTPPARFGDRRVDSGSFESGGAAPGRFTMSRRAAAVAGHRP